MAVLNTGLAKTPADTGYTIDNSCRFDGTTAQLSQTFSSAGTSRRKWTLSVWAKVSDHVNNCLFHSRYTAYPSPSTHLNILLESGGQLRVEEYDSGGSYNFRQNFDGYHRDYSAWYHFTIAFDSTDSTENDRIKVYRNGVRVGIQYTYDAVSLNFDTGVNDANTEMWVGSAKNGSYWDGYLAEMHFVDGTTLTPTSFGETGDYGEWKPIEVTGLTYGTNGFYLDFADSAALGDDAAGSNDFTVSNLAASDQMLDTPTNSFATMNPLAALDSGTTLSEGNLKATQANLGAIPATMAVTSGKWYWEVRCEQVGSNHLGIGVVDIDNFDCENYVGSDTYGWNIHALSGKKYHDASTVGSNVGSFANGDVMGVAVDVDNDDIWFSENGTWTEGDPAAGTGASHTNLSGTICPAIGSASSSTRWVCNFGQEGTFNGNETAGGNADENGYGDFLNSVPSGFLALCTANLDTPAVNPSEYFSAFIYDDGAGAKNIGFQPDIVWLKSRGSSYEHELVDSVRGATKALSPDSSNVESTDSTGLTSFDSDGFTVGADTNYSDTTGDGMVAWCWKINSSGTTATNDTGDIDTEVSANQDAGISMATFVGNETNSTIGHGLSKAPDLAVIRTRAGSGWAVFHSSLGGTKNLDWGTNGGVNTETALWNDTDPTPTVLTIGDSTYNNDSGESHIAYFFHEVDGFSKFGKYTGTGSTDGSFNYCGFRPAYVVIKNEQSATPWMVFDSSRDTYNLVTNYLVTYGTDTEGSSPTDNAIDFLSNGFKLREDHSDMNDSGVEMYWWAFAETPFKYANAR